MGSFEGTIVLRRGVSPYTDSGLSERYSWTECAQGSQKWIPVRNFPNFPRSCFQLLKIYASVATSHSLW